MLLGGDGYTPLDPFAMQKQRAALAVGGPAARFAHRHVQAGDVISRLMVEKPTLRTTELRGNRRRFALSDAAGLHEQKESQPSILRPRATPVNEVRM